MAIVVLDNFTDSNGTSLDAHTPDVRPGSNVWSERTGNWQITGNRAVLAASINNAYATIDAGVADGVIAAKSLTDSTSTGIGRINGVVFRYQSAGNYWVAGFVVGSDTFYIIEWVGGAPTTRASTAVALDPNVLYEVAVTLSGNDISATLDGGSEITYSSSTGATATVHGIMQRDTGAQTDYFSVDDGGGSVTTVGALAATLGAMTVSAVGWASIGVLAAGLGAMTASASAAHGTVETFTDGDGGDTWTAQDTTLTNTAPTYNLGSHNNFEAVANVQNGLMRFILQAIPSTRICLGADLHMFKTSSVSTVPMTCSIHKVSDANGDWIPGATDLALAAAGEPCWNAKEADGSGGIATGWAGWAGCSMAGTDYEIAEIGTWSWNSGDAVGTHYTIPLSAAEVQEWFGQAANNGIVILPSGGSGRHLGWSEQIAAYRPYLVVWYLEPGPSGGGADLTLGAMTATAVGAVAVAGAAVCTLGAMTVTGAGTVTLAGSLAATLAAMTVAGAGVVGGVGVGVVGSLAAMLGSMTVAGAGRVAAHGQSAPTFSAMIVSGSGLVTIRGTVSITFGAMILVPPVFLLVAIAYYVIPPENLIFEITPETDLVYIIPAENLTTVIEAE